MKSLKIYGGLLTLLCFPLWGQDTTPSVWTLQDCFEYAHDHSITLQQNRLSVEESSVNTKEAKAQLFPSFDFSTSHNYGNYPFADGSQSGNNVYTGTYGINASWTIFDGKRRNTIKANRLQEQQQQYAFRETLDNLQIAILTDYLQILYAEEAVNICKQNVEVSLRQVERSRELLSAGSIAKSDLAQLEAQYSNDKYQLVTAEANRDQLKLNLKQLLELDIDMEMNLALPTIDESMVLVPLPDKSEVYATALGFIPSIQSGKLEIEISELDIANAKAGYYPNLSLNAGIGSGHNTGNSGSFDTQMKQGFNESIGLTLSVPIYSRRSNKSAVERARIQQKLSLLDLKNEEKNLLNEIESAWLDASSAQSQYLAAREQLAATQTSFELTEEQFYLGMKNTVEMLTAKNNWLSAQQEELQSRYMALLNLKLLDYYENKPLTLD